MATSCVKSGGLAFGQRDGQAPAIVWGGMHVSRALLLGRRGGVDVSLQQSADAVQDGFDLPDEGGETVLGGEAEALFRQRQAVSGA